MNKFKVGDKVRVISNRGKNAPGMFHFFPIGAIVTVVDITGDSFGCEDSSGRYQTLLDFHLAPVQQKVVVTTDGVTTTARMFSGKDLVKSATAKCSPADEFDFKIGAGIAVSRLLNTEKPEPQKMFPLEEIKAGYLLKVRDTEKGKDFFMSVAPGEHLGPDGLGCCCPGEHWWPLIAFGGSLCFQQYRVDAVYGVAPNRYLLANDPDNRERLWSRK